MNDHPLTSRKFLLAVLSLVSLSALCWFGKIQGSEYVTGLTVTVAAYIAGNVAQKKVAT